MSVRGTDQNVEEHATVLGQAYTPHDGPIHQLCIGRQTMRTHGIWCSGDYAKYCQSPEDGGKEVITLLDAYYKLACCAGGQATKHGSKLTACFDHAQ